MLLTIPEINPIEDLSIVLYRMRHVVMRELFELATFLDFSHIFS